MVTGGLEVWKCEITYGLHQFQNCLCVRFRWGYLCDASSISSCLRRRCFFFDAVIPRFRISGWSWRIRDLMCSKQKRWGETAYIESHPANWLILRDLRLLDEFESEFLVVESYSDDDTWGSPGPNHEMVLHHCVEIYKQTVAALEKREKRTIAMQELRKTERRKRTIRCLGKLLPTRHAAFRIQAPKAGHP